MKTYDQFEGTSLRIGAATYVVPALTVRQYRQHLHQLRSLARLAGLPTDEGFAAIVDVVHAALTRNYPDMTRDQLEDMIDVGNIAPLIRAIMGQAPIATEAAA